MRDNYARPGLQLATVAQAVHASPFYISHLFKRERGTTFLRTLTRLRMEHGRVLLETTGTSVEAIAQAVGYSSARRFRIVFKEMYGLSPREHRASMLPSRAA